MVGAEDGAPCLYTKLVGIASYAAPIFHQDIVESRLRTIAFLHNCLADFVELVFATLENEIE